MWGGGSVAENGADTRRDVKSGWVQQNRPKGIDGAHVQSIQPQLSRDREKVKQIIPKLLARIISSASIKEFSQLNVEPTLLVIDIITAAIKES